MFDYYTYIIIIALLSLIVLSILVFENDRIERKDKKIFYIGYLLIALAALAEWGGDKMSGNSDIPTFLIKLVKMFDYILTPAAGVAIVAQMKRNNLYFKIIVSSLVINLIFQIICLFTNWMIKFDENNFYSHGPLYTLYIIFYGIIILLAIVEFFIYGKHFRKQNRLSLYSIILFIIIGIVIQEITNYRTAYLGITLGAIMMFIHLSEFRQIESDDIIIEQEKIMTIDQLTGLLNRYAYSKKIDEYNNEKLPEDLVVFLIDINGLKVVNDNFGHEAGDELIKGTAECIKQTVGKNGSVYRIGGDEFVVFASNNKEEINLELEQLDKTVNSWTGKKVRNLSISIGYAFAIDNEDISIEKLVRKADKDMYKSKAKYYEEKGLDRRHY